MTDENPYAKYGKKSKENPYAKYARQGSTGPGIPDEKPPAQDDQNAKNPPAQNSGVISDVAKSMTSGLGRGSAGLVGLPGDVANLVGKGGDYLRSKGYLPEIPQDSVFRSQLPGSADVQKGIESVTGEFHKPETTAGKYAESVGQFIPATATAALTGGLPVASTVARYGVLPALTSEAAGQATEGTSAEPYARLAAALVGPGLVTAGRRAITPLPASPERQALVNALRAEGVPVTAGQATGSNALRYIESHMADLPGSGGAAERASEAQRRAFTTAAMRRTGSNQELATPAALSAQRNALGNQFDQLAARNTLNIDPQFNNELSAAVSDYQSLVPQSQRIGAIDNYVQDFANYSAAGGTIPGDTYNALRSRLARQAESLRVNDPQASNAIRTMRRSLDDAMGRSVSPQDQTAWIEARRNWGNLKDVEKAAGAAGENAAQGYVSPAQLRSAIASGKNRGRYARGEGDFAELVRAGEGVMRSPPNSGTPARLAAHNMMAVPGAVFGHVAGGAPGAALGAAVAPFVPGMVGRAVMSNPVQAYLANQLLAPQQAVPVSALIQALRQSPALSQVTDETR